MMSTPGPVTTTWEGDLAWVRIDNPPVNATSTAVRAGLRAAVAEVQGARCAILYCAGKTFVAGGDMAEFDAPPQEPHLHDVVQAIEDSETPFLATMHGSVLGGGFEIAMGCAWRIAHRKTRFALPEVNVGLVPGAGGTQRAPRLVGMDAAIDLACSGKALDAESLSELGGLDEFFDGDLHAAATAFTRSLPSRPQKVSTRTCAPLSLNALSCKRNAVATRARGETAPLMNFDALQWSLLPFSEGQPRERALHLELRDSDQSKALRHAFFAERAVARPRGLRDARPQRVQRVAVVGGGLMGAGIATACLVRGFTVCLLEQTEDAAVAARGRISGLIERAATRGAPHQMNASECRARLTVSHDYADVTEVDLVIEAVFEDLEAKRRVFEHLAARVGPETVLATNTSYLDPAEIFASIPNKSRCLGLHFFSPAQVMRLLEIVALPQTSPDVLATGFEFAKRLGKVSVLSGICDGFIGNRMLAQYRRVAEYMLADGALPLQVDDAARGFGFPMGPFELQDLTGLQIAWANRKRQSAARNPDERYVDIADRLCEDGRFGQRSGGGWYDYAEGSRTPVPSKRVETLIGDYSAIHETARRNFSEQEISDRLLAVLANEGARIVESGIAETDAAIDMVQIHGYAFPKWKGGPMHAARELGWASIAQTMQAVVAESPQSWVLSARVRDAF